MIIITLHINVSLIKNIGIVPINNPIVVIPKASPGLFLRTDKRIPKVIDIVIEKNIIPIKDITIMLSPKHRNGIAIRVLKIATFLIPNLSLRIPPNALPVPMNKNNKRSSIVVLFHEVGIP